MLLVEQTIEREGLWERVTAEDLSRLTSFFLEHIKPHGQFVLDVSRASFLNAD